MLKFKLSLLLLSLTTINNIKPLQNCSLLLAFNFKKLDCVNIKTQDSKAKEMIVTYSILMKEILLGPDMRIYKHKYLYHNLTKKKFAIKLKNQPNAECFSSVVIKINERNDTNFGKSLVFQHLYDVNYLNDYLFTKNDVKEQEKKFVLGGVDCEKPFPFYGQLNPEYFYKISKLLNGEEFGEQESLVINLESNYIKNYSNLEEEKEFMKNYKMPYLDDKTISFVIEKDGSTNNRRVPKKKKKPKKN